MSQMEKAQHLTSARDNTTPLPRPSSRRTRSPHPLMRTCSTSWNNIWGACPCLRAAVAPATLGPAPCGAPEEDAPSSNQANWPEGSRKVKDGTKGAGRGRERIGSGRVYKGKAHRRRLVGWLIRRKKGAQLLAFWRGMLIYSPDEAIWSLRFPTCNRRYLCSKIPQPPSPHRPKGFSSHTF